jgi:2-polyprenyl-3-methyl-5-hydroxy-6-metoxy-1,4-benzoquinol methylase
VLLSTDPSVSVSGFDARPSYWFTSHTAWIRPGARLLDLACGAGRHALPAAELGASVVAVDRSAERLAAGRREAERRGFTIEWVQADLQREWPDLGTFDVVLLFNYLDRDRMNRVVASVAEGGVLMMETFLEIQRQLGWGPTSDAHLLRLGEITSLVAPLDVVHAREAYEPAEEAQWAAFGSVLAQRAR